MNKDEVLDLALDWLVCYKDKSMSRNNAEDLAEELITAIKQARSAPVQEPVAFEQWFSDYLGPLTTKFERSAMRAAWNAALENTPPAAPLQEPPPECQTEAEKRAYAFGWWKALEANRAAQRQCPPCNNDCDQGRNCPARKDK